LSVTHCVCHRHRLAVCSLLVRPGHRAYQDSVPLYCIMRLPAAVPSAYPLREWATAEAEGCQKYKQLSPAASTNHIPNTLPEVDDISDTARCESISLSSILHVSRGQTCRTVDCLQSSLFTVLALFCVVGDCSFVDRRRGWMFWNRTMRARDMFGRLYAVIFVGLLSAMCQPGTSRRQS